MTAPERSLLKPSRIGRTISPDRPPAVPDPEVSLLKPGRIGRSLPADSPGPADAPATDPRIRRIRVGVRQRLRAA